MCSLLATRAKSALADLSRVYGFTVPIVSPRWLLLQIPYTADFVGLKYEAFSAARGMDTALLKRQQERSRYGSRKLEVTVLYMLSNPIAKAGAGTASTYRSVG